MSRNIPNHLPDHTSSSSSGQQQPRSGNTSRQQRYQDYQGYVPPTVNWSVPTTTSEPRPQSSFGSWSGFIPSYLRLPSRRVDRSGPIPIINPSTGEPLFLTATTQPQSIPIPPDRSDQPSPTPTAVSRPIPILQRPSEPSYLHPILNYSPGPVSNYLFNSRGLLRPAAYHDYNTRPDYTDTDYSDTDYFDSDYIDTDYIDSDYSDIEHIDIMSRASSRPTHIAMPSANGSFNGNANGGGRSPNGSPQPTPQGATSPTSPRSSFLPSFIRTRSRAATLTGGGRGRSSPTVEAPNPLGGSTRPGISRNPSNTGEGSNVTRSISTPQGMAQQTNTNIGQGHRHEHTETAKPAIPTVSDSVKAAINAAQPQRDPTVSIMTYRLRLVPHLESTRSLAFDPVTRELLPIVIPQGMTPSIVANNLEMVPNALNGRPPALILKLGRFTEKSTTTAPTTAASASTSNGAGPSDAIGQGPMSAVIGNSGGGGDICSSRVAFKSKVVSRSHAEIWCETGGKFFIRDTSSSSGSFLNHIRLSSPNTDSRPTPITDGDILQLGVDYQGGQEDMYRCVKMRVELGRDRQRAANEFNTNALKQLKALGGVPPTPESKGRQAEGSGSSPSTMKKKASVTDCCICLFSVTVCQSLFIAPCSHVFHYKCIRPLLAKHHPGFSCPLCRTYANLEEDVEMDDPWETTSHRASIISRKASNHSLRLTSDIAPSAAMADGPTVVNPTQYQNSPLGAPSSDDLAALSLSDERQTEPVGYDLTVDLLAVESEVGIPIIANSQTASTSFSQAATPMNETFLSTLAPGMSQRFDLAEESSSQGHGSVSDRVPETLEEESDSLLEGHGRARRDADGSDDLIFD